MSEGYKLKIFVSYSESEKGQVIWNTFVQYLEKSYDCEIIWGKKFPANDQIPDTMMEDMVKRSDIAIFLITNYSEGIYHEMKLWYKYHSNRFINAFILKDPEVSPTVLEERVGFKTTYHKFSSGNPWADVPFAFPELNRFIKRALQTTEAPSWQRKYREIMFEYSWKLKTENIPLDMIQELFKSISESPTYKDPKQWVFRINWNTAELDSYSDKTTCLSLFEALLQTEARRGEYELIFEAIKRVMKSNSEPPKKLSGNIIFASCSISTLKEIQAILGDKPYEKNRGFSRSRDEETLPDLPQSLLLPKNILTQNDNYENFLDSQRLVLNTASKICKYVLCSTVEITVSHSFFLSTAGDSDSPGLLAMSCTATRINKDSLSAISEVPVVIEDNQNLIWFGQPYKRPTSEYLPHWTYHSRNNKSGVTKNLILHFHPLELVDIFSKVLDSKDSQMGKDEFLNEVSYFFEKEKIDFHIFNNYKEHSSRNQEFGIFMKERVKDDLGDYSVIWKPNHGIWVFLDGKKCSDKELVEILLNLNKISQDAAYGILMQLKMRLDSATGY
jgi:hypothetical protein